MSWIIWQDDQLAFEFLRPGAAWLLLPALLVWLLHRRRPREVEVGTTFVWSQLPEQNRAPRRWLLLFTVFLLIAAASRPSIERREPLAPPGPRLEIRTVGFNSTHPAVAEITIPSSRADLVAEASTTVPVTLRLGRSVLFEELVALPPGRSTSVSVPLSHKVVGTLHMKTFPERRLVAQVGETRLERTIRRDPPPPRVSDETESPGIRDALKALTEAGRIREGDPSGVELLFVRADSPQLTNNIPAVVIPTRSAEGTRFLPEPEAGSHPHPVLAGLGAQRWTIPIAFPSPRSVDEVLLDAADGPLLFRQGRHYHFAFDPDATDIVRTAAWPVLLGRLVEESERTRSSRQLVPMSGRLRAGLASPTSIVLFAALVVATVVTRRRKRWLVMACIIVASFATRSLPHWGAGPQVVSLQPSEAAPLRAGPADRILDAIREARPGAHVRVPADLPAPLEVTFLQSALERHQVGLEFSPPVEPTMRAESAWILADASRLEVQERLSLTTVTPGLSPTDRVVIRVTAPNGRQESLGPEQSATAPEHRWEHQPDQDGPWHYALRINDQLVSGLTVAVEAPTPVLWFGSVDTGTRALVSGAEFEANDYERGTLPEDFAQLLPSPSSRGVVIWDGLDPATLPVETIDSLHEWTRGGGTLFVVGGPRFFEPSEAKRQFDEFLPAPLPSPPIERDIDLGVILLDVSGSLRDAQRSLVASVQSVLRNTPVGGSWGIAVFQDDCQWLAPPGTPVTDDLIARLDRLVPGGGTDLRKALGFVAPTFPSTSTPVEQRSLLVVTDGRAPGTAGELASYSATFAERGVSVAVVALGDEPAEAKLRALASPGNYIRAHSPSEAAEALVSAIRSEPRTWRPLAAPVRPASLDPLLAGSPRTIPAPIRRLAVQMRPDARALWVDAAGEPVLLTQPRGQGRVILLATGLDADSRPTGRAAQRLESALSSLLLAATRREPVSPRRAERRVDANARTWAVFPREETDPIVPSFRLVEPGSTEASPRATDDAAPETFGFTTPDHVALPLPIPGPDPRNNQPWHIVDSDGEVVGWLSPGPLPRIADEPTHPLATPAPTRGWDIDLIAITIALALALWTSRSRVAAASPSLAMPGSPKG